MQGLTLKYNTLEDWPDYLKANSLSSTCQLVTKNGNTKINTFILAAISPFLGQVLSTLPPFIESCIILPDIEWTEISQFLKSFSKSSEHVMISKSLSQVLGINLNSFIEVSMRNQSNTIENIVDLVHIKEEDNKKRLAVEISTNIQEYQTINPAKKTMINEIDQTQRDNCLDNDEDDDGTEGVYVEVEDTSMNNSDDCVGTDEDDDGTACCEEDKDELHRCDLCDKVFSRITNLRRHQRSVHQLEKFKCDKCGKLLTRIDHIKRHLQKCTGYITRKSKIKNSSSFVCDKCGKALSGRSSLTKHVKICNKKKNKENCCPICSAKFKRAFDCKRHIKNIHNKVGVNILGDIF